MFSFFVHAEFQVGVLSPLEFRWKISPGEDSEPALVVLARVSFALEIVRDSPMVNIVSQTMNKHNSLS